MHPLDLATVLCAILITASADAIADFTNLRNECYATSNALFASVQTVNNTNGQLGTTVTTPFVSAVA